MFGGPVGPMDVIHQELVVKKRWVSQDLIETEGLRMNSLSRTIDPRELMSIMDKGEAVLLIDVRRKDDYNADP